MRMAWVLVVLAAIGGWMHFRGDRAPTLHPDDPRVATGDDRIVMMAAEWCGYCRKQQKEFELANVRYRILDVDTPEGDRAMQALGARGVPTTVVGQHVVYGYNTAELKDKLAPLGYRVF
ncbi:glutaredoxin family protein [Aerolutibacter ruishenii]|uniref:Glutaredoxin n=1 Tax=Aerolutibacter ruishenii TaxID=686800 RepID=A0A562LKN4_9GAMM|nr:glutaredoxin domain-containing protein [Lysobacter ruishenii]TWI08146.1 glutaredoxin [Lysobacter ruishenii]